MNKKFILSIIVVIILGIVSAKSVYSLSDKVEEKYTYYFLQLGVYDDIDSLNDDTKIVEDKIVLKENNKVIGGTQISDINKHHGTATGGIWTSEDYWGKGYGTELISFARDYAKTIDCYKMYLITNKSNVSACKCYEKAGGINKVDDEIVYVYNL